MTRRKNNKRALTLSLLSLLLCMAMLVGSTFAWFTDNATTKVNTIQAGTLDIQLLDAESAIANSLEGKALSFVKEDGQVMTDILFEPGAKFRLQDAWLYNAGNLHAKYQVVVTGINGDSKLAEVLEVFINGNSTGKTLLELATGSGIVKENTIAPETFDTFGTIELMMQTTAGNEYQGLSLEGIAITVQATQATVESDSFGNNYDEDAEFAPIANVWNKDETGEGVVGTLPEPEKIPVVDETTGEPVVDPETNEPVYGEEKSDNDGIGDGKERSLTRISTAEELAALAEAVNSGENFVDMNFELMNDIDLNNLEWIPIGTKSTPFGGNFNGNGHTIYNLKISGGEHAGLFGYIKGTDANYQPSISNLTIENVTITNATNAGAVAGGAVYAQRNTWYGGVYVFDNITLSGNVVIEGVNVGGILGSDWVDVRVAATNITVDVNNGSYVNGSAVAGGVFASLPHGENVSNVTSNIDVKGETAVGGIAGNAGWTWSNLVCNGNVFLTTSKEAPYSIGAIFGQIADNTYWVTGPLPDHIETYDDLIDMSDLSSTGTLTVNDTITSNGFNSNMIGSAQFTENTFDYVSGKVVAVA